MDRDYWKRQTKEQPLFPDLIWSRPEHKSQAGKLLILGGNAHGFAASAEAYAESIKAGIGTARVLLPNVLQKTVGRVFEAGEYVPSTPSGSFSSQALSEVLDGGNWSDSTLLAGDFGRNSETAILLEQFAIKYKGQLVLTKDALDYFTKSPLIILNRDNTLIVASFAQLQKIATSSKFTRAFTFDMDFIRLVEGLHDFTKLHKVTIVVKHLQNIFVAYDGSVSSTKLEDDLNIWRVKAAANASVWWLQNSSKTFSAITTSVLSFN
jgi:hypothetical protein